MYVFVLPTPKENRASTHQRGPDLYALLCCLRRMPLPREVSFSRTGIADWAAEIDEMFLSCCPFTHFGVTALTDILWGVRGYRSRFYAVLSANWLVSACAGSTVHRNALRMVLLGPQFLDSC